MIGFLLVITPLIVLLYYNNYYASNVVRKQVSQSSGNLLSLYVEQVDKLLVETTHYLYWMEGTLYDMTIYPADSDEYRYARVRLHAQMEKDLRFKTIINSLFIYNRSAEDAIVAVRDSYPGMKEDLLEALPELAADEAKENGWFTVTASRGNALVQVYRIKDGLYVGAWLGVQNLIRNIPFWEPGENGGAVLLDREDLPLSDTGSLPFDYRTLRSATGDEGGDYQIVAAGGGDSYLRVTADSAVAPLRYAILLPEDRVLMNLPYFKRTIYLIPVAVGLILLVYLLLFTRMLYGPVRHLLEGMKRIQHGNLDVQVREARTPELAYLIRTFNLMVLQIRHLKINIYEEELRARKAELRHLQVQINPHFYMNTLYIIYNFAALKDFDSVQRMSVHLANYFRYTMRNQDMLIPLREETEHIRNYLEIQKMRFAGGFSFDIDYDGPYEEFRVPPLSVQPFVENAVIHGYTKPKHPLHVSLWIGADPDEPDGFFLVRISDNGKGFTEEQLTRLRDGSYPEEQGSKHVGIWNVCQRLKMQYRGAAGIRFGNNGSGGATVCIRFPAETAAAASDDRRHVGV